MGVICHRLQGKARNYSLVYYYPLPCFLLTALTSVCGCEVCGVIRCYGAWKIGYKEDGVRVYSRIRSEMQFPQRFIFKPIAKLNLHPSALVNA